MPGISISELIRYDCTDGLDESLIPVSINGNTYGIKSNVFLNDIKDCLNSINCTVSQQGNTIVTCITDTNEICSSIECNETDIINIKQEITDIRSQITEIDGRVDLTSTLNDSCCLSQLITNNTNNINNNASQITTLNGCIDTINQDLLIKANTSQVTTLQNSLNSANSSIDNLNQCTVNLQGQINTLDVSGQAQAFESLSNKVTQNTTSIDNLCNTTTDLQGCVSTVEGNLNAKANASVVTTIQSDLNTAEGNISSLQTCSTKFDNCITNIEGNLNAKANASAVGSLSTALNTAEGNITSLQTCTTNLQNSIDNLDVGSQASAISQLQTDVNTANNNITQSQSDITTLNTCVTNLDSAVNATASNVTTLQSTVNGFNSDISTACTLATNASNGVTTLNTKYGVRVNANGAVAGFGILACNNNSGQCRTAFTIQANCFALEDQTGNGCIQPFVVENNKVRMCGACIKDLSVDTLQIGEQAISSCTFANGPNKRYSIAAKTNPRNMNPLGGWQDIVTATIVSAGCPTIVNFGYSGQTGAFTGELWKGGKTSSFEIRNISSSCGTEYVPEIIYHYGADIRVMRGSYKLTDGSNSQYLDQSPPSGILTYRLQSRFYRVYPLNDDVTISNKYKYGRRNDCTGTRTCNVKFRNYFYEPANKNNRWCIKFTNTSKCLRTNSNPLIDWAFQYSGTQTIDIQNPFIEIRQNKR